MILFNFAEELEETDVDAETKTAVRDEIEQNWRLIMHDDEIHELDEVPEMIAEVSICLIFVLIFVRYGSTTTSVQYGSNLPLFANFT